MPSASSRGWNPAPRHRAWPFRTTRNIVVTGLFTVALVAALVGVGTTVSPPGPRDDATGLAGSATDAPTTSADAASSLDRAAPSGARAPSDTDSPRALPDGGYPDTALPDSALPDAALPDDVAPPVVPIPLPGSRPLGTESTSPGEPALPGVDLPATPPPGFDELPPSILEVPLPGSAQPASTTTSSAADSRGTTPLADTATSAPSRTVALPLRPDPTRDEPASDRTGNGRGDGRGPRPDVAGEILPPARERDAPASTTPPTGTGAPAGTTTSEASAPDTTARTRRTTIGETSLQLPTSGLPTSLPATTPSGWPLYGETTAPGQTSTNGAPGSTRTRATLPTTTPSGWPLYGEPAESTTEATTTTDDDPTTTTDVDPTTTTDVDPTTTTDVDPTTTEAEAEAERTGPTTTIPRLDGTTVSTAPTTTTDPTTGVTTTRDPGRRSTTTTDPTTRTTTVSTTDPESGTRTTTTTDDTTGERTTTTSEDDDPSTPTRTTATGESEEGEAGETATNDGDDDTSSSSSSSTGEEETTSAEVDPQFVVPTSVAPMDPRFWMWVADVATQGG
jgi:hypothetical protein